MSHLQSIKILSLAAILAGSFFVACGVTEEDPSNQLNEINACEDEPCEEYEEPDKPEEPEEPELCDGVDRTGSDTWDIVVPDDCETIQQALDAAASTGIEGSVLVRPGTYVENLDFGGARITLKSMEGPQETILDGSDNLAAVVTFESGETSASTLEGFTITKGRGNLYDDGSRAGGGVWINGASPTLRDLIIENNQAEGAVSYGGGIHMERSASSLENVVVAANQSAYYGGGIHVSVSDDATFKNIVVAANNSLYGGGLATYYSSVETTNAIIIGNTASFGAGIFVQSETPRFANASVHGNSGDGVRVLSGDVEFVNVIISGSTDHGLHVEEGTVDVRYSNLWDNAAGAITGSAAPSSGDGNLVEDPRFMDISSPNWQSWDLTLHQDSPLIDAGDPALEDPDGSRSDIGAYGGPGAADW